MIYFIENLYFYRNISIKKKCFPPSPACFIPIIGVGGWYMNSVQPSFREYD